MLVAVYGTLKRNQSNYSITERCGSEFIGTGVTEDKYCMVDGWGFPRVLYDTPVSHIAVELFKIKDVSPMDDLEGHPDFFERKQIKLKGIEQKVWMYFHPPIDVLFSDNVVQKEIAKWPLSTES